MTTDLAMSEPALRVPTDRVARGLPGEAPAERNSKRLRHVHHTTGARFCLRRRCFDIRLGS